MRDILAILRFFSSDRANSRHIDNPPRLTRNGVSIKNVLINNNIEPICSQQEFRIPGGVAIPGIAFGLSYLRSAPKEK